MPSRVECLAGMAALVCWQVAGPGWRQGLVRGRLWGTGGRAICRAVGCSARVMRVVAAARAMVPARITSTAHGGSPGVVTAGGGGGGPTGGSGRWQGGGRGQGHGGYGGQRQRERAEHGQCPAAGGQRLPGVAGTGTGVRGLVVTCDHSLPAMGRRLEAGRPARRAWEQEIAGRSARGWAWVGGWVGIGADRWWNGGSPPPGAAGRGGDLRVRDGC